MKYTSKIEIDRPINEVIELFDNVDNMYKWMKGLQSIEPISGVQGEVGTKMKLNFEMGKRKMDVIETITAKDLPREFSGTYDANGVHNIVKNFFEPVNDQKTVYTTKQEFHFKGFMKLIGLLFPGAFKKQSMKYLEDFKTFAENN
jgi:uncharacterized membrane protein